MSAQINNDNNHRIQKIKDFLVQTPNDCFLLHALALENHKAGNIDEAISLFEKVIAVNENYIGSYYQLGKMYELKENTNKAIEVYEKGIKIAQTIKDMHSMNELRSALDIILD